MQQDQEWHPTGKPIELRSPLENRFWEKVQWEGKDTDECWPWHPDRSTHAKGYGEISIDDVCYSAHRIAYFLYYDIDTLADIPGDCIRHTCHNPPCCNPNHLVPGSYRDNLMDDYRAERRSDQLSEETVREIRRLRDETDMTQTEIAEEVGTNQRTVWGIVNGHSYQWVDE